MLKDYVLLITLDISYFPSHTSKIKLVGCLLLQQREALRNNLEKLQEEMAALEAVLEQHTTPNPLSKKKRASTAELNTIRLQEAYQKQTDHGKYEYIKAAVFIMTFCSLHILQLHTELACRLKLVCIFVFSVCSIST